MWRRCKMQNIFLWICCLSDYSDALCDNVVEVLERSLYFSRIFLPGNKANVKIPLELRRKLYMNPNIMLNIISDWPFCLACGTCTKAISSAVPKSKINLIAILRKFTWSCLESILCIFLFSSFVCKVTITIERELPKLKRKYGIVCAANLARKGEIQQ